MRKNCFKIILILAISLVNGQLVFGSGNQPAAIQQLEITEIWARSPVAPNNNTAAYFKIHNKTDKEYVIIGASAADIANNVELHKSFVDEKGISRMTMVDKIVVPANSDVEFAPGGLHVMLMDLKKSLKTGDKFTIMLKFEAMEPIKLETLVK